MRIHDAKLSVAEASALLDLDEKAVRKEIEHGILRSRARVELSFAESVYLAIMAMIGFRLAVEDRRAVRLAVEKSLASSPRISRVELSPALDLRVGRIADDVEDRVQRFHAWKAERVVEDPNILAGEPTLRGTRLSVRKIGEMINTHGTKAIAEIREDHPRVTEADIRFAPRWARAYPRRGRPRREALA